MRRVAAEPSRITSGSNPRNEGKLPEKNIFHIPYKRKMLRNIKTCFLFTAYLFFWWIHMLAVLPRWFRFDSQKFSVALSSAERSATLHAKATHRPFAYAAEICDQKRRQSYCAHLRFPLLPNTVLRISEEGK